MELNDGFTLLFRALVFLKERLQYGSLQIKLINSASTL